MKDEDKVFALAQKIDNYDNERHGCHWSHILEFVEKAYLLGRETKQKEYELQGS